VTKFRAPGWKDPLERRRQRRVPPLKDVILTLLALLMWKRLQIGIHMLPIIINIQNISLYTCQRRHAMSDTSQWTDLHEILHKELSHGSNHLFRILCRSVEWFRICAGSNFAIFHWLSRSLLTQGYATARLWQALVTSFLDLLTSLTLNDLEPPEKGFLVNFFCNFWIQRTF